MRESGGLRVPAYVVGLSTTSAALLTCLVVMGAAGPGEPSLAALPVLVALVVAAEALTVRFRVGRDVDSLNLVEAAAAPLLFAYAGWQAVTAVAAGQLVAAAIRRNSPLKAAFNVAQWSLATGCGALVVHAVGGSGLDARSAGGLLLAIGVVAAVNNGAFTAVLALSSGTPTRQVLRGLAPVVVPGWLGGVAANAGIGLLLVAAFAGTPATVPLFAVPLVLLHLAYRGQASARADRARLDGLHRAAAALAVPIDPREAVPDFLRVIAATFDARVVALALRTDTGREVHRLVRRDGSDVLDVVEEPHDLATLSGALAGLPGPSAVRTTDGGPLSQALALEGGEHCLAAPLRDEDRLLGVLLVVDPAGFEQGDAEELAVVTALAREASGAFAKGRLLTRVLEERRTLDDIVRSTSDGIATIDADGVVLSWNPALETITGVLAQSVVGHAGALRRLALSTPTGRQVDLSAWAVGRGIAGLPAELVLRASDGTPRRLACGYSVARRDDVLDHPASLVVVARDVTPAEEMERLREQFRGLVEMEAAQRVVVEHLQEAVMPPRPSVAGIDLGVTYVASDPSSPTGGDLYDCQVLPDGWLHLAVVDVLGHGVPATQDALAVVHAIRTVVFDGTPLQEVVARCDTLLGRQDPELVATVVLARLDPRSGAVEVVSGGHPPAMVVTADGTVRQVVAHGGAIGWPGAGSDDVAHDRLGPGDSLLLYTDGLVESRRDIVEGLDDLARHAGTVATLGADALSAELVAHALADSERRDDTLALVVRRTVVLPDQHGTSWDVRPDARGAAEARRAVTGWLEERGLDGDDVALVAGELLANAARAARTCVGLTIALVGEQLRLTVTDDGPGFDPAVVGPGDAPVRAGYADDHGESGRGLLIVRAVCDDVRISSTTAGTTVLVHLPVVLRGRVFSGNAVVGPAVAG